MTEVSFNDTQTVFPVQPDQNDSELLYGVEGAKIGFSSKTPISDKKILLLIEKVSKIIIL